MFSGTARLNIFLLAVLTTLVGINLRGAIIGIPPIIPMISEDLNVSYPILGLLTTIPLLIFGLVSPFIALLAKHIGANKSIVLGMTILVLALTLRPLDGIEGLLIGTFCIGIAIATGNVLLPEVVRTHAGAKTGTIMGITTASYGVGASLASVLAVPIEDAFGWRIAMAWLALPAAVGLIAAVILVKKFKQPLVPAPLATDTGSTTLPVEAAPPNTSFKPWRYWGAWAIALFFGTQSFMFFTTSAWITPILSTGADVTDFEAATGLAFFQGFGVLGMLLIPLIPYKKFSHQKTGLVLAIGWVLFYAGLLILPEQWLIWCVAGGIVQGMGVSLALVLVAVRPVRPEYVRNLSAMMQFIGYTLAMFGPILLAYLAELSDSWLSAIWILLLVAVANIFVTFSAASKKPIGE